MEILQKKLSDLKPYEKNPRRNEEAVKYVANSIKEFGFKVPIVVDKNNVIVAGHTRFKAAKKLGLETAPCVVADDLTDDQVRAFRLADNKVAEKAEWDFDLLEEELKDLTKLDMSAFGFEDEEEQEHELEAEEDGYDEEPPEEAKTKPGDVYRLGGHILMCGDSAKEKDVKRLLNGDLADLVVTDPPYNVNVKNAKGMKIENDNMANEQFKAFLESCFANMASSLKAGGLFTFGMHQESKLTSSKP